MKFLSSTPEYFNGIAERFTKELSDIQVVQGLENLKPNMVKTIYVDEVLEPKDVVSSFSDKSLNHLIQKNNGHFEEDLWTTGNLILTPEKYFLDGAKSLIENPKHSLVIEFAEKPDKPNLKEQAGKFIEICGNQGLSEAGDAVIEELYMNAMLDAPKEAARLGISAYGKAINKLELECNDTKLVISCTDPYGALDVGKFLSRMEEVYAKGAGEVINLRGQGGAGLGCVIMFEHSMSLYLGVHKNKSTRVSCVLPVGMNNRQRAEVKKSLHRLILES